MCERIPLRSCSCLARRPLYFLRAKSWSFLSEPFSGADSRAKKGVKAQISHTNCHWALKQKSRWSKDISLVFLVQLLVPQIMSLQFMFHHAHAQRANFIMAHHSVKLGKTTRKHERDWHKGTKESTDVVSKCLPGETEKDVNDDSCQLYTLFPVLPQHSRQGSQGRLCTQTHNFIIRLLHIYRHGNWQRFDSTGRSKTRL